MTPTRNVFNGNNWLPRIKLINVGAPEEEEAVNNYRCPPLWYPALVCTVAEDTLQLLLEVIQERHDWRAQSGQQGCMLYLYLCGYREFMDHHLRLIAKSALAPAHSLNLNIIANEPRTWTFDSSSYWG